MEAFLVISGLVIGASMLSDDAPKDKILNASAEGQWVSNSIVQPESKVKWVIINE